MKEIVPGSDHTVDIVDIAFPRDFGVARLDDFVLFVPASVPGDRVRVRVSKVTPRFAFADIVAIEEPSPGRVAPFCGHFGSCGGCTLQHVRYERQVSLKENYVYQTLRRVGEVDIDAIEAEHLHPSGETRAYRSKIELAFGAVEGEGIVGFRERVSPSSPYSNEVTPVSSCPVFSPAAAVAIEPFRRYVAGLGPSAVRRSRGREGTELLREVVLREAKGTGELMAALLTGRERIPLLRELVRQVEEEVTGLASFSLVSPTRTDVLSGRFVFVMHIELRAYESVFFSGNSRGCLVSPIDKHV